MENNNDGKVADLTTCQLEKFEKRSILYQRSYVAKTKNTCNYDDAAMTAKTGT